MKSWKSWRELSLFRLSLLGGSQRLRKRGQKGSSIPMQNLLCERYRHKTWREGTLVCQGSRNNKLVHQVPQILVMPSFFQRKLGYLPNLSNVNSQLTKWCWNNYSFTFYVWVDYFHVCETFADISKIENFYGL